MNRTSPRLPRKDLFDLPPGVIYLDGNSLGPLVRSVPSRLQQVTVEEWGGQLIKGWNACGWMEQPQRVGDKIARLVGAPPGTTVLGDTLSIKVYQALAAALHLRPTRKVVLSDAGNFPTDLYMAQGLINTRGQKHTLRIVEPEEIISTIRDDIDRGEIAAVLLTHVDYRTGRMHDMAHITQLTHKAGAVSIWDLAHSAGAVPVDVTACQCEFAVGCTYKYLNGGPGAPAFMYVRPDIEPEPALAGWLGHAAPFAFEPTYRPAPSVACLRVGTPPVLQMSVLEAALEVWDHVTMDEIRAVSVELTKAFIQLVEANCPSLVLASPRDSEERGSQVSFFCDQGYAVMQALIARGVIGDFRAPNIIRFGFTPLYIDKNDVEAAVDILTDILRKETWRDPVYNKRQLVT